MYIRVYIYMYTHRHISGIYAHRHMKMLTHVFTQMCTCIDVYTYLCEYRHVLSNLCIYLLDCLLAHAQVHAVFCQPLPPPNPPQRPHTDVCMFCLCPFAGTLLGCAGACWGYQSSCHCPEPQSALKLQDSKINAPCRAVIVWQGSVSSITGAVRGVSCWGQMMDVLWG